MPQPTALDLLRRTESLLSALHGSVGRHDNLAANLGCAGCELRNAISSALPLLGAESPVPYGQLADRLDAEHARRVKAAWSPTEHTAAEEWSSVAAFVRGLAREQQPAGRAALLHETADGAQWLAAARFVEAMNEGCGRTGCDSCTTREDVAAELRRVAAEEQPAETQDAGPACTPDREALRDRVAAAVDEGFRLYAELEDLSLGASITDSVMAALDAERPVVGEQPDTQEAHRG